MNARVTHCYECRRTTYPEAEACPVCGSRACLPGVITFDDPTDAAAIAALADLKVSGFVVVQSVRFVP